MLAGIEVPFRNRVIREKNRYIRLQAEHIGQTGQMAEAAINEHKQELESIYKRYYERSIRLFSEDVSQDLLQKSHRWHYEKKQELWETLFAAWIANHGGEEAQQTAATTQQDIRRTLIEAQQSEAISSGQQMTRHILEVRGFSAFRADMIARTETHNAAMFASEETAKSVQTDTGLQILKKWVPARDERTRVDHAAMAGTEAIALDSFFQVGGERLRRPGDPAGSAGNVINCRCVLAHEVVD